MANFKQLSLFIFVILLVSTSINAQDKVWTGAIDSSWHVAGNWNPSGVPTSTQTVTLRGNTTPSPVITSNVTIRSVTINQYYSNPGDKLTIRNNATLTLTDDFTVNGAGILNIVNGHVEMTGTSSGTNNFNQNSAQSEINITNGSFEVGTISENIDAEIIGTFNLGNGSFTVNGNFDVSNSDTFNAQDGTVLITGNSTINGTYNGNDGTTTFEGEVTVRSGGVLNLGSGTINFDDNTTISNNGTVNFGTGTVNFESDVSVASSGFVNIQGATVNILGDADFSNNGNLTITTGSLNIGGNASLTSGGSISLGGGQLQLQGNLNIPQGGNFNADSSTVVFSGDSTQTVSTNTDITFNNVRVDSGAVLNSDGGSENTIVVEGDLIINEGGGVVIEDDDQIDVQGEVGGDGAGNVSSPAPFAISATAPTSTSVKVTFNKGMVESLAENTSNYSIKRVSDNSIISITSASLNTGSDSTIVTLIVGTLTDDVQYEITMNNLDSNDGGELSNNHKKRFTRTGPVTFYSRQSGNWNVNSTWSRTSHSGSAATSNPSNTTGATIIVGDGDVVTITNSTSIINQTSVEVKSTSTLRVGTSGNLTTGTKSITGLGTFSVTSGTLQIGSSGGIASSGASGNIRTTTRSFSSSGSYVYNGSSSQVTGTGLPNTVVNLTINNTSSVTLDADVQVTSTLSLTNGSLIIESGNNLIANTKSISSGNLVMRNTITGSNGWRLLSSPISSTYGDFLDNITTQGYSGSSLGNASIDSLQPNVLYYFESYPGTDNQRWRAPANSNSPLTSGRGLYTYIFGNIASDARYNNSLPIDLEVTGQENEGPIDLNVSYTTDADSGWNLVGNPYAATINWNDESNWTKTNIDNTVYVWDYTTSQYKTWNGTTGDLGNGLISPFQGFWIKANDTSPSLVVNEDAKTTGGVFVGKTVSSHINTEPKFSILLSDDINRTSTHFMFSETAKLNKDRQDGYRLVPPPGIPSYLDFASVSENGNRFSINNLPRGFGIPIEIPLSIDSYESGYSVDKPLHFIFNNFKNIPEGWTIYLIDTELNKEVDILSESTYLFDFEGTYGKSAPNNTFGSKPKITSKASSKNRFHLRIDPGSDASELPNEFKLKQNYPNPFNPSTTIEFNLPLQSQVALEIYDILGRKLETIVSENLSAGEHSYTWNATRYASGVYIYRLSTAKNVFIKKMTLVK